MSSAETLTLAAFLHDRINEDAAVARKASLLRVTVALDATKPGYGVQAADMVFVRRFAPMRVRAECEAKRRIVASAIDPTVMCEVSDDVLRALALPYADHPHYREEWRPNGCANPRGETRT